MVFAWDCSDIVCHFVEANSRLLKNGRLFKKYTSKWKFWLKKEEKKGSKKNKKKHSFDSVNNYTLYTTCTFKTGFQPDNNKILHNMKDSGYYLWVNSQNNP